MKSAERHEIVVDEDERSASRSARLYASMKKINPYYYLAAGITLLLCLIGSCVGCYCYRKRRDGFEEMQDEAFGDLELKSGNSHNLTTDMGGEATAATDRKQTNLQKINADIPKPKKKNMGRFTMNKLLGN